MATIASLVVHFGADTSDFEAGINRVNKTVSSGLASIGQTSAGVLVGNLAQSALGKVQGAVTGAVNAFGNFEQTLDGAQAVLGATSAQMDQLKTLAMKMGAETSFSASQAADAIQMLGANGLNVAQILGGAARAAVDLAAATGGDLTKSANVITDVFNNFGKQGVDLTKIINGISGVTIASKFGLEDYALALAQGGGKAAALGTQLADFNAILAATSSRFSSGSDAGTSLGNFLARLVPQTKEATIAMLNLGLITGNAAEAYKKNLMAVDALEAGYAAGIVTRKDYLAKLKGLKDEQKYLTEEMKKAGGAFFDTNGQMRNAAEMAAALQKAFGGLSDIARTDAATTIFGQDAMRTALGLAETGANGINAALAQIGNTSAASQANIRLDNLNGVIERMQGSIETASIALGETLAPIISRVAQTVEMLADRASKFLQSTDFKTFVEAARPSLEALGKTLGALGEGLSNVWKSVIQPTLSAITPAFKGAFDLATSVISSLGNLLKGDFVGALNALRNGLKSFSDGIDQSLLNIGQRLLGVGKAIVDSIVTSIRQQAERVTIVANEIVGKITKGVSTLGTQMLAIGKNIVDGIVNGIRANLERIASTVRDMGNAAVQSLKTLLGIKSPSRVFMELGENVGDGFAVGILRSKGGVLSAVGQLGDVALNAQGSPMGGGGSSGGSSTGGGGGGLDLSFLLGPLGQFAGLLDAINPVAALVAGVMKVLQPAIQTLIYPLVRVGSILAQAFMPVLQALFPVFKLLGIAVLAVGIGIGEVWNAIASALNAVLGWLGINLPKLDMKVLYNGMNELINMTWDEADARDKNTKSIERASEAMTNVPDIWKAAYARFNASDGAMASMNSTGGNTSDGAMASMGSSGGNYIENVTIVSNDPETIWQQLEPYLRTQKYRGTGNPRIRLLQG